jgi:hypothetical protein
MAIMHVFDRGKVYTRKQIQAAVGGGLQDYLPHREGVIVDGCFNRDLNPEAPRVVLPGTGSEIGRWARVFARQTSPIPVFIKRESTAWYYMGEYVCERWTSDASVIAEQRAMTSRTDVTMVLYLRRM